MPESPGNWGVGERALGEGTPGEKDAAREGPAGAWNPDLGLGRVPFLEVQDRWDNLC